MTDRQPAPTKAEPERTRRPRGPALSRERILAEALSLIDGQGLEAFSFRTLAGRLGVQAMSLYHYFPSKQHLFEALVEICIAEAMAFDDTGTWQARMRAATSAYRQMALRHPGFFLYFGTFRLNNQSGMSFLQAIVQIFADAGLTPESRARHFRIMGYYLVGACIDETLGYANGAAAVDPVQPDVARRDFPAIMSIGTWFSRDQHEATFRKGIEILIAGIEADLAAGH